MFNGLSTAVITPFSEDGSIDIAAFKRVLEYQISGGVDGIVVCGTTGESPTFSDEEFVLLMETARTITRNRCFLIAGVGSNDTKQVIHRASLAVSAGTDGLLVVSPYYNKPTQKSLIAHYLHIADRVNKPIMVYNVPGRTSVNILPDTIATLAAHQNIVAVKEACGDINQAMDVLAAVPANFTVLSGDDAMALPMIAAGAKGLVSVAANEAPHLFKQLVETCLAGDFEHARTLHYKLLPLMKVNFVESNPIPVKFAMSHLGFCKNELRLPLTPLSSRYEPEINQILLNLGLKSA